MNTDNSVLRRGTIKTAVLSPDEVEVFRILTLAQEQYDRYHATVGELTLPVEGEEVDYGYRTWDHPVSVCMNPPEHAVVE